MSPHVYHRVNLSNNDNDNDDDEDDEDEDNGQRYPPLLPPLSPLWARLLAVAAVVAVGLCALVGHSFILHSASAGHNYSSATIKEGNGEPANLHNLALFIDRLQQGLPVHVTAIGGSNIQGHIVKVRSNNLVSVFVEWLNEKFPVHHMSMLREVGERKKKGLTNSMRLYHESDNRAVGGVRSAMASYCFDRVVPPCSQNITREPGKSKKKKVCVDPDLLLIDFAINDFIPGNDVTSFNPTVNMERLIRQSLVVLPHTAIILVHFASWQLGAMLNAELLYRKVAQYYHVPEISIRKFQEQFLYQKDYLVPEPWAIQPDGTERLLPNRIPLPLPQLVKEITPWNVTFNVTFNAVYNDAWHLNDYGHLLLTSLLTKKVLQWSSNYEHNNKTSLADSLMIPQVQDRRHSFIQLPTILSRSKAPLPFPLSAELPMRAELLHYSCAVMYYPYNPQAHNQTQNEAESFLGIIENNGWLYGHFGMKVDKYTFYVSNTNTIGQSLTVDVIRNGQVNVNTLVVAYVRSWNSSMMGSAECWLSCDINSDTLANQSTPKQTLNGSWSLPSSQADSTQIWPLDTQDHNYAPQCALRYLHIVHSAKGDFRFIGLMYA